MQTFPAQLRCSNYRNYYGGFDWLWQLLFHNCLRSFVFHKIVIMYFAWNSEFLETERQRKAVTCDVVCHQGKEMRKMRLNSEIWRKNVTLFTEKFDSPYDIERLCDVCPTAPLHVRTDDSGFVMRLYNNNLNPDSGFIFQRERIYTFSQSHSLLIHSYWA